jgi:hypothetical protein
MPAAISLDTLKFARRLTDAGMDPRHAEAIVTGLSEADTSELATKTDVGAVKADVAAVRADVAAVKADLTVVESALKSDIAELKAELKSDIAALKAEMFRFMYLQAAGIVGLTVALIKLLP